MFFRVVTFTVLLGSTLVVNVHDADLLSDPGTLTVLGLIIGTYILTIVYAVTLSRIRRHVLFIYLQLIVDQLTTLMLVILTGGTESIFTFMFALTVMNAAILLYRRGAMITAGLSSLMILALVAREWLMLPAGTPSGITRSLILTATTNIVAVVLVALLAGYLSDQLRSVGQRLLDQSEDLEQLRALNQHIITSLQSGLVSHTLDGRIIFFNSTAETITGLDAPDVLYHDIRSVFPRLPEPAPAADAPEGGPLSRWEETFETRDGQTRVLGMSRSPLIDATGTSRGAVLVFQDLTHVRAMEQQIRRSERFAAIGKMAAGIAHEIRNPLASISGSIQMLNRGSNLEATDRRLMDIVLREVDRLNSLVTDFLKFARPAPPQLEQVRLSPLLSEVSEVFGYMQTRGEGGPRYEVDLMVGDTLSVTADPRHFKQVFWNLLNNAAEAMPSGGLIQIRAIEVGAAATADDDVEIRVADTGVGIAAENLTRIFDPFYSTKPRGSGLGLALVHRIVEEHGGSIRVESEPGSGATFIVRLPSSRRPPVLPLPSPEDSLS